MLIQRDKKLIWHPFTQEKTAPDVLAIKSASGAYLYDEDGRSYLDLIASWWVNLHGHAHPRMAHSIYEQALQLEHVVFAGCTHEPAVQLCEELSILLPPELNQFFFSDNGSTAVEVAIKMAYQYWINLGYQKKNLFLSFEGGYHGDTFGAMSVGARSGFHDVYSDLFFQVLSIPYPDVWDQDPHIESKEEHALLILDTYLNQYPNQIAAMILEPLVQGASGMRLCRPSFVNQLVQRLKNHSVLVIFDEVMTGFCRTGTYFALNQLNMIPDFICLSKGLTGGFLPLALTVTHHTIHDAFVADTWQKAFAHGHSYTANPLACRAALTSLHLLQEPDCQAHIQNIHSAHQTGMNILKTQCPSISKARILGTIAAFDLNQSPEESGITRHFLNHGLLLRPLGNTVYLLPTYAVSIEELESAYRCMARIIQ